MAGAESGGRLEEGKSRGSWGLVKDSGCTLRNTGAMEGVNREVIVLAVLKYFLFVFQITVDIVLYSFQVYSTVTR